MPPKGKAAPKPKASEAKATQPSSSKKQPAANTPPATIAELSQLRLDESRPFDAVRRKQGLSALSRDEQTTWYAARFARQPAHARNRVPIKTQRELWRQVNEASIGLRALRDHTTKWGLAASPVVTSGGDVGGLSIEAFGEWSERRLRLTALEVASRAFRERRERARRGETEGKDRVVVTETDVDDEKERRREMAEVRQKLYGVVTGRFALDPEWDDVVPIPHEEPDGALAVIAYPAEYAEAISYLRAVMASKEYSDRCLRLTETIIEMNPAHYTVWLYRAAIIQALKLSIPYEMEWLNKVALDNLKNYQIWHHRHLLVDSYYPTIAEDAEATKEFGAAEQAFLTRILAEDAKNYHVWSYRSYLVDKLGMWDDPGELAAVEDLIDADVRNNSAWSHRFFLVFSHPARSTPGVAATEPDPAAPSEIVDREVSYAKDKIVLAPQNQSPWNYLRGVLVKGGRKLAEAEEFSSQFVVGLGEGGGREEVTSTHALDLLAEIYAEKGDKERADLCLRRLGEKWDRIRVGYWEWRRKCLN
ncbi:hypothetical protein QBC47DRAFT_384149 [Echria macrotheca]|uniref:Protein farnesyltransferase/geranylgeranyltransferase type-1 subunit alpha n=1 Tax=Echria macrotheca TaxID=438768 RepID=A0AAJ0BB05_9PEZI|nr:hypothetical protein QBC47DRAFT_384149 [Echria macrotheca]